MGAYPHLENHDTLGYRSGKKEVPFEEALTQAGIGKYTYTLFAVSLFSFVCGSIELFSVSLISALAQCDLHLNVYRKGFVSSAPMLGIVASAHLWGYIADTRGRKYCLTLCMAGNFLFAFAASFVNDWEFLAVLKFLSTACSSGTHSVTMTMLGETTPASYRTRLLQVVGVLMMSQSVSAVIAYLVQLADADLMIPLLNLNYHPWRILTQALASFSLINLLIMQLVTFESPKYCFGKGMDEKGLDILRKIYAKNTGNSADQFKIKKVVLNEGVNVNKASVNVFVSAWRQTVPLFTREYIKYTVLVSYISIVVYALTAPFIIWLPLVLKYYSYNLDTTKYFCELIEGEATVRELTISAAGNSTLEAACDETISVFTLSAIGASAIYYALVTIISAFIIKYTGRKWMLIGVHVICSIMLVVVNHIPNVAAVFVFMAAWSTLVCIGICAAYAVELFPTRLRAMAVCLTIMMGRGFSFISINLIGQQLESDCSNFMYMVAAFMFSGALAGLFLPEEKKDEKDMDFADQISVLSMAI